MIRGKVAIDDRQSEGAIAEKFRNQIFLNKLQRYEYERITKKQTVPLKIADTIRRDV